MNRAFSKQETMVLYYCKCGWPCTWDVDEGGVHFATFARNEAFDEGGASSAPYPG